MILFVAKCCGFAQSNIGFQYFYDDLGQLTKVVDSTGTVIEYIYDPVGNILQIKRSTVNPGTLAILNFTPQRGGFGQSVTIQGQGFSANPVDNTVQFSGTAATVVSATANTLIVNVPNGASSGPISVTVGGQTATSTASFKVLALPVITSLSCKSGLLNAVIPSVKVTGTNLNDAIFSFAPVTSAPSVIIGPVSIDPSGTSASMIFNLGPSIIGTFALVATNAAGNSSLVPSPSNRFTIVDPHSLASTSGNGIPDVIDAAFCADPLDPNSVPPIPKPPGETESLSFSVLNGSAGAAVNPANGEAESPSFSMVNGVSGTITNPASGEVDGLSFSVLNSTPAATVNLRQGESESLSFSVVNGIAGITTNPPSGEAESLSFSVLNGSAASVTNPVSGESESLIFSVLNGTAVTNPNPPTGESESITFSVLNGNAGTQANLASGEIESLNFSLLNGTAIVNTNPSSGEGETLSFSVQNAASKTNLTAQPEIVASRQHPQAKNSLLRERKQPKSRIRKRLSLLPSHQHRQGSPVATALAGERTEHKQSPGAAPLSGGHSPADAQPASDRRINR